MTSQFQMIFLRWLNQIEFLMKNTGKIVLTLCAVLAAHLCNPAMAESGPNEKAVKVRFRLYGCDEPASDLYYRMKDKDKNVTVNQGCRSVFYDYSGPAVISFYRLQTDSHGNIVREAAAQADLANAGPWPLILLSNNKEKPGAFTAIVLKDDLASFPSGTYAFSNFTSSVIDGQLGAESFHLAPGENTLIPGKPKNSATTLAATFYTISDSGKVPLYTNNWAIAPATRTRVFFVSSSETPSGIATKRLMESTNFPPESSAKSKVSGRAQ